MSLTRKTRRVHSRKRVSRRVTPMRRANAVEIMDEAVAVDDELTRRYEALIRKAVR